MGSFQAYVHNELYIYILCEDDKNFYTGSHETKIINIQETTFEK